MFECVGRKKKRVSVFRERLANNVFCSQKSMFIK